jgi:hypothetical protein
MDNSPPSSESSVASCGNTTTSSTSPMSCSNFPQQHHHPGLHNFADAHFVSIRATLQHMRHLESTTYKRPLVFQLPEPFNGLWRQQIVEWMYTLVKYCKLRHESAAAASYYLDVAVGHGLIHSPNDYQLCATTALYLALKVYDSPCMRVLKLSSLVKLGNGEFTEDDIVQMERDLVKLLDWRLNPPTANCFLLQYLTLLPQHFHAEEVDPSSSSNFSVIRDRIEEIALLAIEQVTARDYFLSIPPSIIGYSSMLFAIESLELQHQLQLQQHQQQSNSSPQRLSFLEFQMFVFNMTEVADLDSNNSPILIRASVLLDRTMKSLPIPESFINGEGFINETAHLGTQSQRTLHKNRIQDPANSTIRDVQFWGAVYGDAYSPSRVIMH